MIIGIDEVGRGCLAGPLCVAAVSLKEPIEGLKDSKLLSAKKREYYDQIIRSRADYLNIVLIDSKEIDNCGMAEALKTAFIKSIAGAPKDAEYILDGNVNYLKDIQIRSKAVIKADNLFPEVSAASIIAKVYRDKLMEDMDIKYPGYNLANNKGYGSKEHIDAIYSLGPIEIHRMSFRPISEII